mgnify:CR=1 FL=1
MAPISMMRPDGASAQETSTEYGKRGHGVDIYDCLHSCQPGPVDTYVRLLLALIDENRDMFLGGARPSPSRFFKDGLTSSSAFLFHHSSSTSAKARSFPQAFVAVTKWDPPAT